jgi:hypothetical protein
MRAMLHRRHLASGPYLGDLAEPATMGFLSEISERLAAVR